jgi:hypothetical protein
MRRFLVLLALAVAGAFPAAATADVVDDNPAATSLAAGRLDVAARAADGTILVRHLDVASGAWSPWSPVPGLVASSGPAMVADAGRLWLAARGPDNAIWLTSSTDGTAWTPWQSLGGTVISGPGIDNRTGTTELDVGGIGTNGAYYYRVRPSLATPFNPYAAVSTASVTAPLAVSRAASTLDAFTRNADSTVTRLSFEPGKGWTATNIGGAVRTAITPISRGAGTMDLYSRATGGQLVALAFDGTAFGTWVAFAENAGTSAPAAAVGAGGRVDMVVRDATHLYQRYYDGEGADLGWHPWQDAGPIVAPPPPVDRGAPNGSGAADRAVVGIGFKGSSKTRREYGYHRRVLVRGTLTGPSGPIAGARLSLMATPTAPGSKARLLRSPVTAADGTWSATLAAGPSRRLVATYRAFANDATVVASAELVARARTRVTLRASRRTAHRGDRVRFTGRLLGRPIPRGGKLLALQAFDGGRWRTFAQPRTGRHGRYRASYRFVNPVSRSRVLRFRVRVPREAAYPYQRATSSARRLRLLPG